MEIQLSTIWAAGAFLITLQLGAFTWRISREISVAEKQDINWLPLADIINLIAIVTAFVGIYIFPISGIKNIRIPQVMLGLSIILFAGYPFILAGHYELFRKGKRSYVYAPRQEIIAVSITILAATIFLLFFFL